MDKKLLNKQIVSKRRVADHGEVFTSEREVNAMLDLVKQENVYPERYETMNQAKRGIDNYMRTYNYQRLHSSIGYIPPMDLYEQQINRAA